MRSTLLTLTFLLLTSAPVVADEDVVTPFRLLKECNSDYYPKKAKRLEQQGSVLLLVCVDAKGRGRSTLVTSSGWSLLDKAAQHTAACSRWTPATKDGKPVDSCRDIRMNYELKDGSSPTSAPPPPNTTPAASSQPPADPHP